MSNHNDLSIDEIVNSNKEEFNYPLFIHTALYLTIGYLIYSTLFGDSSIGVLQDTKQREKRIVEEYNKLQDANQKLQKKHFELIQLTPQ